MIQARPKIRLFIPQAIAMDASLTLSASQSHYLSNVMRCREGQSVAVFNGQDGEWQAEITSLGKKSGMITAIAQLSAQHNSPDLWLVFAPIKHHMERMIEKAVELGTSHLIAVVTQRSIVRSINEDKLMAHAIEAAEQCERHDVPTLDMRKDISVLLAQWPADRVLLHADETGAGKPLTEIIEKHKKYALLIGPEGGFTPEERQMLSASTQVRSFGMGPRILRADTAAIAALACIQALSGDWNHPPRFEGDAA